MGTTFWEFGLYGINFNWTSDNHFYRARVGKKQLKNFLEQIKNTQRRMRYGFRRKNRIR